MRIEDLMIGDWVLYEGKPKRVDVNYGNAVLLYDPSKTWDSIYTYKFSDGIEPIPLTKEFILKNGFEKDGSITYMSKVLEAFVLSLTPTLIGYLSKEGWFEIDYHGKYPFCKVTGIHEFQHLLKLLKINKNIEI